MRAIADGRLETTKAFADEMYFCLGCLACMTACPAGVNYAELFEHARAEAEQARVLTGPQRGLIRGFTLRWLFMDQRRLQFLGRAMGLYQRLGLQKLIRSSGILKLLPKRFRELEAMSGAISGGGGYISAGIIARDLGLKLWWQPWDAGAALADLAAGRGVDLPTPVLHPPPPGEGEESKLARQSSITTRSRA